MSTEQQEKQDIPEAVRDVAAEMLDGRRIGSLQPSNWRPDIRDGIAPALAELAGMQEALASATDDGIGQEFFRALNRHCNGVTPRSPIEFGAYLRTKAGMATGEPVPVLAYPEGGSDIISGHEGHLANLRTWANDTTDDVLGGVDEQARMLIARDPRSWPNDGCQTSAAAKTFLGRVMDYKRFRLSPLVPEVGMRLRVDDALNRGAYFVLGSVVEVSGVLGSSYEARGTTVYADGVQHENATQALRVQYLRRYHQVPEGTEVGVQGSESEPEVVIDLTEPEPEPVNEVVARLNQQVTDLTASVARQQEQIDSLTRSLSQAQNQHQSDIDTIGQFLMQKANDRGWCSEYDEGIDELNRRLTISLPQRNQDVEVEISGYVRVPYTITVTVNVNDRDDTDQIEQDAMETFEQNYSARDLMVNYGDSYNAEVEDDPEVSIQ